MSEKGRKEYQLSLALREREEALSEWTDATWRRLCEGLKDPGDSPRFEGILALSDQALTRILENPGIFMILGPPPHFPLLHIGSSQGAMGKNLGARLQLSSPQRYVWRWEDESDPPPTYAACITFHQRWGLISSFKASLVHHMGEPPFGDENTSHRPVFL